MKAKTKAQKGQALAEAALVAFVLFLLLTLGLVAVPLHRAHTAALASVYACEQFITQHPLHPDEAAQAGSREAQRTLSGGWNALAGATFHLSVYPPRDAGKAGSCSVTYTVRLLIDPLGIGTRTRTLALEGRSERWKADWWR